MSKDQNESLFASLANTETPRRAFLRNTGLAALAAAGAMTIGGGSASAQVKEPTVTDQIKADGQIPESARITLRMMRSLTLYNMAFSHASSTERAAIKASAIAQIKGQYDQLVSANNVAINYTPNPDDDSDPIPWWWWIHRHRVDFDISQVIRWADIPVDAQIGIDIARSLSIYNNAFQVGNADLRAKTQGVALRQLRTQIAKFASVGGGIAAWDEGDDLCPKWWPWPWPPRRRFVDDGLVTNPALEIGVDMVDNLIAFNIGSAFSDAAARTDVQKGAIDQLNQQLGQLNGGMTRMGLIVPGDDFCGTPWPWPWPWGDPRRIGQVINPDPWKQLGAATKVANGVFRSLTLFATAAVFQDIREGETLQKMALGQVGRGLRELSQQIG